MAKKMKKAAKKAKPAPAKSSAKKKAAAKTSKKAAPQKPAPKSSAKKSAAKKAASPRVSGSALLSVTPGFTANDAKASMAWYCDVLGFTVAERWEHEGQFLGGRVMSGAVSINIGQDDWKMGRDRAKGTATRMYIAMGRDIDAYADQIKARGGKLDHDPKEDWGLRAFSITDPDGFKLTFMHELKR